MQPSSLLGTGPLQGITSVTACLSSSPQMPFHDPNHHQQQQQHQHFTSQLDQQTSQQQHNNMDDLLEQMFSMPTWPEVAGGKAPWEYNANGSTTSNSSTPNNQKFITMSLLPGQTLGSQESEDPSRDTNQLQYAYDESLLASRLRQHQLGGNSVINSTESNTSPGRSMVLQLSTGNPSHMLASLGNSPQANANTGCEGGMLPLPLSLGHGKPPDINEPRSRDDIEATFKSAANNVRDSSPGGGIYSPFVGTARPVRSAAPNFHSQAGQMPMQGYGGMPQTQPQPQSQHPPSNPVGATPARPNRVRARRGQATDPHSIAERLRRERIAERMKALQELVPNANKTDKASMLDEIIEYVKFLQLQVKVLSMSRLGGAGAVAPLVADISSEGANNSQAAALARANGGQGSSQDGLAMTERQVAKLMEEDMGSAMQYLQSKGLCLMPISLASAISGSGSRSQPGAPNHSLQGLLGSSNALEPTNSALSAITSVSVQPSIGSPASGLTETDNANKAGNGSTRNPKDSREANAMTKSNGIAPKKEDEPQRRTSQ